MVDNTIQITPETDTSASVSRIDSLLGDADGRHLRACIKLLALNIANYQAKLGVVPLEFSLPFLTGEALGRQYHQAQGQAFDVLEEALLLVSGQAADPESIATPAEPCDPEMNEHRSQPRVSCTAPVRVRAEDSDFEIAGALMNLSWGGAAFKISVPIGRKGEAVYLVLPSLGHDEIEVRAQVVRIWDLPEAHGFAVRFDSVQPEDVERLDHALATLLNTRQGDDQRRHQRLSQRVEIEFDDDDELRATLEDISNGGALLTLPEAIEMNQSLQLVVGDTSCDLRLKLRGKVVRQQVVACGDVSMYRVGLKFEHPPESLKEWIEHKLHQTKRAREPWTSRMIPDTGTDTTT